VNPNTNSVEVYPRQSNSRHPVDGVLVGAGSRWMAVTMHLGKYLGKALGGYLVGSY
jgi:hypothetical protein